MKEIMIFLIWGVFCVAIRVRQLIFNYAFRNMVNSAKELINDIQQKPKT